MTTIYGQPYIKRNGTIKRAIAGSKYEVPAFEIRALSFSDKRDEFICGPFDYTEVKREFNLRGYKRYGSEVRVER